MGQDQTKFKGKHEFLKLQPTLKMHIIESLRWCRYVLGIRHNHMINHEKFKNEKEDRKI